LNPGERPFDNYRTAITDPPQFFGRDEWLGEMRRAPFWVRVLLGGRRLGKTSALRAVEWSLPDLGGSRANRPFPVFISLELEQPSDLPNFLFILVDQLQRALDRWRQSPWEDIRKTYRTFLGHVSQVEVTFRFLKAVLRNPPSEPRLALNDFREALQRAIDELRKLDFHGVCFLLDEAEFIVRQSWANDCWAYFRGLKDTDMAIKPFLGLVISGYRGVAEYQQRAGSDLQNIAHVHWLNTLSEGDARSLIAKRASSERRQLPDEEVTRVIEWAGGHPFLTQQMLNHLLDAIRAGKSLPDDKLMLLMLGQHDHNFSAWWNVSGETDGFSEADRRVYRVLAERREASLAELATHAGVSALQAHRSLTVLAGTGVILQLDEERYRMGARLFEEWVIQQ